MGLKKVIESFAKGIGSLNIFPEATRLENINPAYSTDYSVEKQNTRALAEDWNKVGKDINYALEKIKGEIK